MKIDRVVIDIIVYGIGAVILIKYFIDRISAKKPQASLDQIVREKENQMRTSIRNLRDFTPQASTPQPSKDESWIEILASQNEMNDKFYEKLKKAIYWDKGQALSIITDEIVDIFPLPSNFAVSGLDVIEHYLEEYEKYHHTDHVLFWCAVAIGELLDEGRKKFTNWNQLESENLVLMSLLFYFSIPGEMKKEGKTLLIKFADFSPVKLLEIFISKKNYDQLFFNIIHRSRELVPLLGPPQLNLNGTKSLKDQFKEFSKQYHPDRFPMEIFPAEMRDHVQALLNEQFAVFNQEFRRLSNKN